MNRRFSAEIDAFLYRGAYSEGEIAELTQEEAKHVKAFRLKEGDSLKLLSGFGDLANAKIVKQEGRDCHVLIGDCFAENRSGLAYIDLACGVLSDRSRLEFLVEKCVELGTRRLILLNSERSEGRVRIDRLNRVADAALKQSQQMFLPELSLNLKIGELVLFRTHYDLVLLADEQCDVAETILKIGSVINEKRRILLLVGPEGGFSEDENRFFRTELDARQVSLGTNRLRAETAALVGLATLKELLSASGS